MTSTSTVLAIIEPDLEPRAIVARAAWLARLHDARLDLVWSDPDVGPLFAGWYMSNEAEAIGEEIATAQQETIAELASEVDGVTVGASVLEERPVAEGILKLVHERQPRMVVNGTHYHSSAARALFVDTDWHLIRECPCPLYLAKPEEHGDRTRIVAAVDPTHAHDKPAALDRAIIEAARNFAQASDGEVHLLHTWQRVSGIGNEANRTFKPIRIPVGEVEEDLRREHREKLDALASDFSIPAEQVHQLPGSPREVLPAFARDQRARLVVMGALARWSVKRAVIGSTVERVLDHLPCDVLIVRTPLEEK